MTRLGKYIIIIIMNVWESALWFAVGAVTYRLASYCLSIGYAFLVFRDLETTLLRMLRAADYDVMASFGVKYSALSESGLESEKIKKIKLKDAVTVVRWREITIQKFILSVPESLQKFVEYTNWEEAQHVLRTREAKKNERGT